MTDINYSNLIIAKRRQDTSSPKTNLVEETESDRARVIYSSSFRRLQQKAQVFSLEDNAAVRSRLTHSFEVGQIGRYLARRALHEIKNEFKKDVVPNEIEQAFVNLVETACLIHDIGNPPFGHFGEAAIQKWFSEHGIECVTRACGKAVDQKNTEKYMADFEQFDGNCQGYRLLTKLLWTRDEYALNLTYSQLASFIKYVRAPYESKKGNFSKKPGYFLSEEDLVKEMWSLLSMEEKQRFPLAYLMEASDDIAYCISDIEDGIEKGLINEDFFFEKVIDEWNYWCNELHIAESEWLIQKIEEVRNKDSKWIEQSRFLSFKTKLTNDLVSYAAQRYVKDHEKLLKCEANPLLENDSKEHAALKALKSFSRRHLYRSETAESIELAGYRVISGLLDHYKSLISCTKEDFFKICGLDEQSDNFNFNKQHQIPSGLDVEVRLFNKLPKKYRRCYYNTVDKLGGTQNIKPEDEWFYRSHLIVDYIAGMTDHYALETYQLLSGIQVS